MTTPRDDEDQVVGGGSGSGGEPSARSCKYRRAAGQPLSRPFGSQLMWRFTVFGVVVVVVVFIAVAIAVVQVVVAVVVVVECFLATSLSVKDAYQRIVRPGQYRKAAHTMAAKIMASKHTTSSTYCPVRLPPPSALVYVDYCVVSSAPAGAWSWVEAAAVAPSVNK